MRKLLLVLLFFFLCVPTASAQTYSLPGITVTPSLNRIDLRSDSNEFVLSYKNNTSQAVELSLKPQDFKNSEDGSRLEFVQDETTTPSSLAQFLSFSSRTLILNPQEEKTVTVTIQKDTLEVGAHYASINAEIKQVSNTPQVELKGVLGSLVFVRTGTGKEVEKGEVTNIRREDEGLALPKETNVTFRNTGNVELIPFGLIELRDPLGQVAGKGIMNTDSLITLPRNVRVYTVKHSFTPGFKFPGIYSATLNVRYGREDSVLKKQIWFFSQGSLSVFWLVVVFIFIVLGFSLITYAIVHYYHVFRHRSIRRH